MATSPLSFVHGVASGDPYADSVILWTRITPPQGAAERIDVSWEISRSPGFEAAAIVDSGLFSTSADRDWTVKVEADGLNADTPYYYRFRAGDAVSMVGQTKTLPVGGDPVRLAVFSCANFPAADTFAAYGRAAAINAVNPYDALVHLGDYIYEYGPGGYGEAENAAGSRGFLPNREIVSLDDYRQRYAQYHTDANLQAVRAAAPLIAIWDDHETANDSWDGGAQNHQSATEGDWLVRRDAALKAYHEWLPIREPELRQASDGATASSPLTQGYRSFNFGDVLALHILETRLTARDQQLSYPNAAAVQARIGAILADPTQIGAYAGRLGRTPPADAAAIPAFAAALAPLVTQELVFATVQQAWADPNRDLIGDTQLAWLQQQLASSSAPWQVLGQQVLMQSMALPAELLLNAGNPALLDKYAAPLQKLATGTAFADLTPAEKALFAEAGKIPYNLDAWDGYGVERETILQSALAAGKRLISLAGDTHNAWAGLLDTMGAGQQPAGTVAGVEFATPGVTSPGLEKYLPGGDAYIRSRYPAVDGLDGLFMGYINGLQYADVNRRGFLDLSVTADQASGSFQFLNGVDPLSGVPRWSSETVVASRNLSLSLNPEATPEISWQSGWRELDLVIGMALDAAGSQTLLDPAAYASVPKDGIQLADVTVLGSAAADRIYAGVGSTVDAGPGSDELFNTDSLGSNRLVGGIGSDSFFLRPVNDVVIGGSLLADPVSLGLPALIALVDRELDNFLIDSSDPAGLAPLRILDYEPGIDKLLLDGVAPQGDWLSIRKQLQDLNIAINAAPQLSLSTLAISLNSGTETTKDLAPYCTDIDGDNLQLVKLAGPEWITVAGTVLKAIVPAELTEAQLAATNLQLGFSDGTAFASFTAILTLNAPPSELELANTTSSLPENSSTSARIKVSDIVITDDALGTETIVLSGADASSFELDGNNLYLKAGTLLNYEVKSAYAVSVSASDSSLPGSTPVSATFNLSVTDVNEAPTALAFANTTSFLAENSSTSARIKVADIVITDDALGTETIVLSGADASSFELDGNNLYLKAGTLLNYEAKSAYAVSVSASDSSLPGSTPVSATFNLSVTDVNEAPTALAFANTTISLAENSNTSARIKVADIVITDDELGIETVVLSGTDAGSFELDGNSLYLKAGTVLNYETKSAYAVNVSASDSSLPGSTPASATFSLSVADVNVVSGSSVVTTIVSITTSTGEIRQIPVTIGGANFSSGSGLAIIPTSEINQESLATLDQLGVNRNSTGLDFVIDTDPGQSRASLGAQLDLVAADLLPQLSDGSGRLANRKLLYYALNSVTGSTSPLTFDPITGAGARFFDINNDGTPDFFALSLIDGGYGDKDGLINGRIDDPSFAGFADLTNLSFRSPGSGMLTISDLGNTAPVAVSLRANLSGRPSSSNQIGYVVLSPDELPGSANLLNDLTWLRGRAKTLFSSLESTDVTLPANTRFERDILLINGQSLRFFEVQDASLDQLTSLSDSRFRYLNQADLGNTQASFSSSSGVIFSLGVLPGDPGLNALIGQAQAQAPVLDLSALTASQRLQGTVALGREADFNSVAGFYRSLDAQGTIVAADGVTRLRPGDVGYGAAALRSDNLVNQLGNLSVADDQISSRSFAGVTGGSFLAPYVVVNGNTFFAYGAANSDGISHFRSLGNNLFGLEDIAGGGDLDYDDLVIGFNFTSII
jgi:phosphodiesterase/alkaline phosphatase D-like protein